MMGRARDEPLDLTVVAVPLYFGSMAAEYLWLRHQAATRGPTAGDYERRDTVASLAMGVGSLVAPLVVPRLLRPFTPGRGRYGRALVVGAAGAAAVTTLADIVARRAGAPRWTDPGEDGPPPLPDAGGAVADDGLPSVAKPAKPAKPGKPAKAAESAKSAQVRSSARRVASVTGVTAVITGGVAVTTAWAEATAPHRLWRRRVLRLRRSGPVALALAIAGWDFIYYWNHRFMHESRYMWALHVVHHSSERYNLSTALRQPVADALGTTLPYGALCLFGIPPGLVGTARGVNLLYQFWIHTETIGRLGSPEAVLNTPSHHRVHHGSNRQYLDRNHGSILIVWDRLFGTFEPEGETVVYGLTKNIKTFNVGRIITHEYADMLRDVAGATSWAERLSYVLRGPGWATRHRAELASIATGHPQPA
jgi:sterol desaturase/sphingolipid hydroxylase (fatty acid hydroxylase superfamily)